MSTPSAISLEKESAARADAGVRAHARHNQVRGIVSGAFAGVAGNLLHPHLIIAGMIYALTGSAFLVAVIPIMNKVGAITPQLIVSRFLEHRPIRRPFFIAVTLVRTLVHLGVVLAMWGLAVFGPTPAMLVTFFAVYLAMCATNGVAHITFMDMTGRLIPHDRIGSFLGMRQVVGGVCSIVGGIAVVQPLLSIVVLPYNYLFLAVIGTAIVAIDMSIWATCREEPGPAARRPTTVHETFRRGLRWLRDDPDYRCYLWLQCTFRANHLGLAFFIPYGAVALGGGAAGVAVLGGIMISVMKFSQLAGSALWGRMADRHGTRPILIGSGLFITLGPLAALIAPLMPPAFLLPMPFSAPSLDLPHLWYLGGLACMGMGIQGTLLGGQRFLILRAPAHRRTSYMGFVNTVTLPLALLPLAAAWFADRAGMSALFAVLIGTGLLAVHAASRMSRPGQPGHSQSGD